MKPGDWLDFGAGFNQPDVFDRALAARKASLRDVRIGNCLSMKPRAFLEQDPEGAHFACYNWHFSGYNRRKHDQGLVNYLPCHLGEIPDYYRRFIPRTDIAVLRAAPMDAEGYFNLGPVSVWHPAIVETLPDTPRVVGTHVRVHRSQVDYVIEGDDVPTPELPNAEASEVDRAVAALIAEQIEDGSCLQVGIGGMPNAVTALSQQSSVRDLGIHTEMLNDRLVEL